MKTRIIVEREDTGDTTHVSLRGESEGLTQVTSSSFNLAVCTARLKSRIEKVVEDFDPSTVTLSEIAHLQEKSEELQKTLKNGGAK